MKRVTMLFAAAVLCSTGSALRAADACEGGSILFQDNFADNAGGWAITPDVDVKDNAFVIRLRPDGMESSLNITYTVHNADICGDAVWPQGESKTLGAGLLFWGEDTRSYFQFGVLNSGKFWIARRHDGKWYTVVENVASSAIDTKPGAANKLRVKVSGNTASFYINGTKVRDLRGQPPKDRWRFGLSGDNFDKDKDARVTFKSVKVTD
jgi:hypothetical protein